MLGSVLYNHRSFCGALTPAAAQPQEPLAHSRRGMGRELGEQSEKSRGLRYRQLEQVQQSHVCRQSKSRNSFTVSHGQAGAHPAIPRAPSLSH